MAHAAHHTHFLVVLHNLTFGLHGTLVSEQREVNSHKLTHVSSRVRVTTNNYEAKYMFL